MCQYTYFTTEEREKSRVLKAQGLSIRAIAKELGRALSSVSREFRRNCYANGDYAAYHADKLYRKRRKNCGRKAKLLDDAIRNYVMEKMNLRWSPEQIAGRAKRDKEPFCISFPTIYRAIDSGILPPQLKKIMRFKWKHKNAKEQTIVEKSQILRLLASVLPVLKIVRDMVIGKAIRFSACGKQAVLAHMWSVNQDTLLHSE